MKEEVLRKLEAFNLSRQEAQCYLAILKTGEATAYQVAKNTNLKRPTVYTVLERLHGKNIVSARDHRGNTHYIPVAPKELINRWYGQLESIEAELPALNAYYHKHTSPRARVYEQKSAVDAIYSEFFAEAKKGKEFIVLGPISAIGEEFRSWLGTWEKIASRKNVVTRELILAETGARAYMERMQRIENHNYEIRMTDMDIGISELYLIDGKVGFVSAKDSLLVTILEDIEVFRTQKALFDMAWTNAEK